MCGYGGGQPVHQKLERLRVSVHRPAEPQEGPARPPFDRVRGEREGRAAEADQGRAVREAGSHEAQSLAHAGQLHARIGDAQLFDVATLADRMRQDRTTLVEHEREPHRLQRQEDVTEHDGGVDVEAPHRLQRYFGGELGVAHQLEEATGLGSNRVVLGQIPPGLTHQPDRRPRQGLTPQRAQEQLLDRGHDSSRLMV